MSAKGNNRWYRPPLDKLPNLRLISSLPHKVKGFADDLTVISSLASEHEKALQDISKFCSDLDLTLKPPKCASLVFDGKKVDKKATFEEGAGRMISISSGPTKLLGHIIGASNSTTWREYGKKFELSFHLSINKIGMAQI